MPCACIYIICQSLNIIVILYRSNLCCMLNKRLLFYFFIFAIIVVSCAKRGSITGGEKDITPPKMTGSSPENFSTGFTGKMIKITFDEYVKLKGINKQLIVSPPMKKMPNITPQGTANRQVTIQIYDTLQPNTTYSFNFGESIEDNNEGNKFQQFKYVFSTGSYIDSLSLKGRIKDAYNKEPDNYVTVMLYEVNDSYTDSIVYKENPRYITNTLDSMKTFSLDNLKEGKYLLVALKDKNNNYKFDPKQDKIGFHNEFITVPNDTVYEIELFKEILPFKALRPTQASGNKLLMGYEGTSKNLKAEVRDGSRLLPSIITQYPEKDSVYIWYPPIKTDSLNVILKTDLTKNEFSVKIKNQKNDTLSLSSDTKEMNFRNNLALRSSVPLRKFDKSLMQLIKKDSTQVPFTTVYDSLNMRMEFVFEKEELEKYSLTLFPGAVTDYMGSVNDTLKMSGSTRTFATYGNLKLTLLNVKSYPVIIELTNAKGEVQASAYSEKENIINFFNINPALYTVRVIYDENKNRIWDTGNFLEKRQTEQVIYYPKEIDVRANWDVDQVFNLAP